MKRGVVALDRAARQDAERAQLLSDIELLATVLAEHGFGVGCHFFSEHLFDSALRSFFMTASRIHEAR